MVSDMDYFVHETACVEKGARIGKGTKIWHWTHVRENAIIGKNCNIGQGCYIDEGVKIGNNVKIQNGVSVYKGVIIEDDVFMGPHCVTTNDKFPRANIDDFEIILTLIKKGASIGANATIVCGVTIGECAMIGAGAIVTKDVEPGFTVISKAAKQVVI